MQILRVIKTVTLSAGGQHVYSRCWWEVVCTVSFSLKMKNVFVGIHFPVTPVCLMVSGLKIPCWWLRHELCEQVFLFPAYVKIHFAKGLISCVCTIKFWHKSSCQPMTLLFFLLLIIFSPGQMKPSSWLFTKLCTLIATSSLCWRRWAAWLVLVVVVAFILFALNARRF